MPLPFGNVIEPCAFVPGGFVHVVGHSVADGDIARRTGDLLIDFALADVVHLSTPKIRIVLQCQKHKTADGKNSPLAVNLAVAQILANIT